MTCKHAIITGGDFVPYGMSGAQLPDSVDCGNPAVPEDELDDLTCDESCLYFEADNWTVEDCKERCSYFGSTACLSCKYREIIIAEMKRMEGHEGERP